MTISITFQGDDWPAVHAQMLSLLVLGATRVPIPEDAVDNAPIIDPLPGAETPRPEPEPPVVDTLAVAPPGSKKVEPKKPKIALGRKAMPDAPEAPPVEKEPDSTPEPKTLTPAALIDLRAKTLSELQAAYADGKQKQVFKLLADLGNGAKSFRELQLEDFPPLRKAIDEGALA